MCLNVIWHSAKRSSFSRVLDECIYHWFCYCVSSPSTICTWNIIAYFAVAIAASSTSLACRSLGIGFCSTISYCTTKTDYIVCHHTSSHIFYLYNNLVVLFSSSSSLWVPFALRLTLFSNIFLNAAHNVCTHFFFLFLLISWDGLITLFFSLYMYIYYLAASFLFYWIYCTIQIAFLRFVKR